MFSYFLKNISAEHKINFWIYVSDIFINFTRLCLLTKIERNCHF